MMRRAAAHSVGMAWCSGLGAFGRHAPNLPLTGKCRSRGPVPELRSARTNHHARAVICNRSSARICDGVLSSQYSGVWLRRDRLRTRGEGRIGAGWRLSDDVWHGLGLPPPYASL